MKKIKSGIKKIVKSKAFKIIAVAALIYVGGAALGAWKAGGSLARVNGILAKGGSAAGGAGATSTASTVGAAATPALAPTAAVPATGTALANSVMPQAVGGTAANTMAVGSAANPLAPGLALPGGAGAAAETGAAVVKKGVISRMMEGAANAATSTGSWMAKNPLPSAMIAQGVAGALTPDQLEIRQEEQRLAVEEDERQRRERNKALRMDGTESSYNPEYGPLKFASTGQNVFANNGVLSKFKGVI